MSANNPYEDVSRSSGAPIDQSREIDLKHVKRIILMALVDANDGDLDNQELVKTYCRFVQEVDNIADDFRVAIRSCWRFLLRFAEAMIGHLNPGQIQLRLRYLHSASA